MNTVPDIPALSPRPVTVLLVDDDEAVRKVLCRGLEHSGLRVTAAAGGKQAMALLRAQTFDWIVTDIIMPDCEGLEVVQFARTQQPSVRIIAMSGGGGGRAANYLKVAQLFGAAHVLQKPFSYTELAGLITGTVPNPDRKGPSPDQ